MSNNRHHVDKGSQFRIPGRAVYCYVRNQRRDTVLRWASKNEPQELHLPRARGARARAWPMENWLGTVSAAKEPTTEWETGVFQLLFTGKIRKSYSPERS